MIRLLDLGPVSALRSQAVYHGLAAAATPATPATVVVCWPREAYFCVGYHQRAGDVLDLARCRREGWPVLRRRIGGGAVYLDDAQVFYQVVVPAAHAPLRVTDIFARYLAGPVLALRRLGVEAVLRAPNEIEVGGRRIAGTGGGRIGESVVVVGNLLVDFPDAVMARAWRAPSPDFRRLAHDGVRRHVTTLTRELGARPSMNTLGQALAAGYAETLGQPVVPGELTPSERRAVAAAGAELSARAFARGGAGPRRAGLKIARGVYVHDGRSADGRVRVAVRVRDGCVDAVAARGPGARHAPAILGTPVDTADGDGRSPADVVGDLLAAATGGAPSAWYKAGRGAAARAPERNGIRCDTAS